jgi:hypothetical protein
MMKEFKFLRGFIEEFQNTQNQNRFIPEGIPFPYEPMRTNRFIVIFPETFNISPYFVRMVNRPSMRIQQHGQHEWEDIEITLYDPISPSMSQNIFQLMNSDLITQPMTFLIQMLDPTGVIVSEWSIWGRVSSIDYGMLDYNDDSTTEIKLTISVSNVILNF